MSSKSKWNDIAGQVSTFVTLRGSFSVSEDELEVGRICRRGERYVKSH